MLMGNKIDLIEFDDDRILDNNSLSQFIEERKIFLFAECSALNNLNIIEPITEFYTAIYEQRGEKLYRNFVNSKRRLEEKKSLTHDSTCC